MVRGTDLIQSDFGDDRISQSVNFISKFVRFGGFVHPVLFPLVAGFGRFERGRAGVRGLGIGRSLSAGDWVDWLIAESRSGAFGASISFTGERGENSWRSSRSRLFGPFFFVKKIRKKIRKKNTEKRASSLSLFLSFSLSLFEIYPCFSL